MRSTYLTAIVILTSSTMSLLAQAPESEPRTISVSGTAVTRVSPDTIVWRISVREENPDLVTAKRDSDAQVKGILSLREEFDIKPEDVETGHLRIEREYERDEKGRRGAFKHFVVRRSVTMRHQDFSRFDEFLSKLVTKAQTEVSYDLQSSRIHEVRFQNRLEALRIARRKAEAMAKEMNEVLGRALSISEYQPQSSGVGWRASNVAQNVVFADSPAPAVDQATGTFAPGSIEERATIYVVFEIK
jgi:uncharacterized protein YggE